MGTVDRSNDTGAIAVASDNQQRSRMARMHNRLGEFRDAYRKGAYLDRDRVLESRSWMRLGDVTQVIGSAFSEDFLVHNRMTHSLRVGQVSRAIALRMLSAFASPDGMSSPERIDLITHLGGLDPDVVATAGLSHDIGHPPFGHSGEEALDKIGRELLALPEGFEGNAQTFRIVCKLERAGQQWPGMNLTRASRAALLKYPWLRVPRREDHERAMDSDPDYRRKWRKFNAYKTEEGEMRDALSFLPTWYPRDTQTLEASIMDVADDITYALNDLEDFFLAGITSKKSILEALEHDSEAMLELVGRLSKGYPDYFDQHELFPQAMDVVRSEMHLALVGDYNGEPNQIGKVRWFCSELFRRYVEDVGFAVDNTGDPCWPGGPYIGLSPTRWHQVQILKAITRTQVIQSEIVQESAANSAGYIREIVEFIHGALERPQRTATTLPRKFRNMLTDTQVCDADTQTDIHRCILDYVCTLTDSQARALPSTLRARATGPAE